MAKCVTCGKEYSRKNDLQSAHYNENPSHAPEDWIECPKCGKKYDNLSGHWRYNPDHIPKLTEKQHEVITGVLMSDGYMRSKGNGGRLVVNSTTKEYLEHLDNMFSTLSTGVHFKKSAEEAAKGVRDSGFSQNAKEDDYSDIWTFRTRTISELEEYVKWYDSGKKVWPEDMKMTPTVLKHLYCGDGCKAGHTQSRTPTMQIRACNEYGNGDKIKGYFDNTNMNPEIYSYEREDGPDLLTIWFSKEDSKIAWEYMGDPLPGFEYKWPDD